MKVLALTTYPREDASRRLRIEPLLEELTKSSEIRVHALMTDRAFRLKNHKIGRFFTVLVIAMRSIERLALLAVGGYDGIIVHREAFPFFTPIVERLVTKRARVSLVDVDDAIYETPTHGKDWRRFFRDPARSLAFPDLFDIVTVASPQLFADRRDSANILNYPTCPPAISTRSSTAREVLWTGSASTLFNLEMVLERTLRICERKGYKLVVLGAENVTRLPAHANLSVRRWSQEAEDDSLASAALGIMPLVDSPWDRGKAAYKAVRYVTAGVPCLISPVGVNAALIDQYPSAVHGANDAQWEYELERLLEAPPTDGDIRSDVERARVEYNIDSHVSDIVRAFCEAAV